VVGGGDEVVGMHVRGARKRGRGLSPIHKTEPPGLRCGERTAGGLVVRGGDIGGVAECGF
jgi:hypothetical protein